MWAGNTLLALSYEPFDTFRFAQGEGEKDGGGNDVALNGRDTGGMSPSNVLTRMANAEMEPREARMGK